MSRSLRLLTPLALLVLLAGCFDLSIPPRPGPPGPGTIQGRLVYAIPGRTGVKPASGATLALVGTSITTQSDAEGRFVLGGLLVSEGQVLVSFDADNDGVVDRQKTLDLSALHAGPGRDLALGDVQLARNATASGVVLRGDTPTKGGHAGTTVFVPGAPFVTTSADDGSYVLDNLPEGALQVAYFRDGFAVEGREVTLRGGEESQLSEVTLVVATAVPAAVTGVVRLSDGTPAAGAVIRFAAAGVETTATCDATGHFTVMGLRAGVYQAAIEMSGATSVRLFNVLVGAGDNELTAVTLVPGMSTPISLDGGLELADAGPPPVVAMIETLPPIEPGVPNIPLSGLRSTGVRPLTYHWAQEGDAGVVVTLSDNDSTTAVEPTFTAPLSAALLRFSLTVTDALQRVSEPAHTIVRVGRRPTVVFEMASSGVDGGTTYRAGDVVTLRAQGAVIDGSSIAVYEYRQVSGPAVAALNGPGPGFLTFTAPAVIAPVPLTVEVKAVTSVGRESEAATLTIFVEPSVDWSVAAHASTPTIAYTGSNQSVRLDAVLQNAPDASFSYLWSRQGYACDAGVCDDLVLSNYNQATTEFIVPKVEGVPLGLTFELVATRVGTAEARHTTVDVLVTDGRLPMCTSSLGALALTVRCDEPLTEGSAMIDTQGLVGSASGNEVVFWYPNDLRSATTTFSFGVKDFAGNEAKGNGASGRTIEPMFVSDKTSTLQPAPGWAYWGSDFKVVGHLADSGNRSAWVMDTSTPCGTDSCLVSALPFSPLIPGTGVPPRRDAVFSNNGTTFIVVSTSGPTSVFVCTHDLCDEPMGLTTVMHPILATSINRQSGSLGVVMLNGSALEYTEVAPDGGVSAPEPLPSSSGFAAASSVSLSAEFSVPVVMAVSGGDIFTWKRDPQWARSTTFTHGNATYAEVDGVAYGASPSMMMAVRDTLNRIFFVGEVPETPAPGLGYNTFDFERLPDAGFLLSGESDGGITLVHFNGDSSLPLALPDGGLNWNGATPGTQPDVTVVDNDVGVAWQQGSGTSWRMVGRRLR